VTHIEKTLTVRSERSRASGEVEEQARCESGWPSTSLRGACPELAEGLRPNGDGINP